MKAITKRRNPWGTSKVPVHGNVSPEVAMEIDELKSRYGLKSTTEALNMLICEGLAAYKTKGKQDENQAE